MVHLGRNQIILTFELSGWSPELDAAALPRLFQSVEKSGQALFVNS